MNTTIKVESDYGAGSIFWFDLPLLKSSFEPVQKTTPVIPDKNQLSDMHILLAEDNKVNQLVAARMLQKWHSHVTIASNGEEAVTQAQANKFDVILMDLDMPVMDGYESAAIIKDNYPDVPVIALTAASFDDMNKYLLSKGFCDVVQKPFMPDDLYNKIILAVQRA
jgi:CheY-like chemotaxis protein